METIGPRMKSRRIWGTIPMTHAFQRDPITRDFAMTLIRRIAKEFGRYTIATLEAGVNDRPAFVLLHGWPQSSRSFGPLMKLLADEFFVLAMDLPGIGGSRGVPPTGEKSALARIVREVIRASGAQAVIVVGHDGGGMIAFSYLREFAAELDGAVIMNTVIPGVPPWEKVISSPHIWHFAFHSTPQLPELLVADRQRIYFDYFYDVLAFNKAALTAERRDAYAKDYASRDALRAGFSWYSALEADAKQNQPRVKLKTPLLYLRGDRESGKIGDYVQGLQATGLANVSSRVLSKCGHFAPDEAPVQLAQVLRDFRAKCDWDRAATPRRSIDGRANVESGDELRNGSSLS